MQVSSRGGPRSGGQRDIGRASPIASAVAAGRPPKDVAAVLRRCPTARRAVRDRPIWDRRSARSLSVRLRGARRRCPAARERARSRDAKRAPRLLLDEPADVEVADIGVLPAFARLIDQAVSLGAGQYLVGRPGIVIALDRLVVGAQTPVFGQAGAMLQELAQRVGPGGQRLVEDEPPRAPQGPRRRGAHTLVKTP